jgi:hypothetical protein
MSLALMLALQASAPAPAPVPAHVGIIPVDFDLKEWVPRDPCEPGNESSDIVVCGRRNADQYRLTPLPGGYGPEPVAAEMGLGGGTTGVVYVESVGMPQGQVSKRIMFGIKTRF